MAYTIGGGDTGLDALIEPTKTTPTAPKSSIATTPTVAPATQSPYTPIGSAADMVAGGTETGYTQPKLSVADTVAGFTAPGAAGDEYTDIKPEVKNIEQADIDRLGLDQTWLGLPMSVGYTDAQGNWVEQANKMELAKQMHDLRYLDSPEMIDLMNSDAYQALQTITDQWASGALVDQDMAAGQSYFENLMGLAPGGYTSELDAMRQQQGLGIQGQQGLSDQYTDEFNRKTQLELQQMRDDSAQLMEQLGASGRSVKGYDAMLSFARQQADFQSQRDLELTTQDMAMKQAEYDALKNRYEQLYNMGSISIGQYTAALADNRKSALQGYAQQITAMAQQNQQNLQAYETQANVMYQTIMTDLGVSTSLLEESSAYYEQYMAPHVQELQEAALADQTAANKQQAFNESLGGVISMAGTGASVGAMFGGPVTALVGGLVGAGVSLIGNFVGWLFGG